MPRPPVSGLTPYAVAGCRPLLSSGLRYLLFVSRGCARCTGLPLPVLLHPYGTRKIRGLDDRMRLDNLGFVGLIYIMLFPLRMVTVVVLALVLVPLVLILAISVIIPLLFEG